jgi:K(+)-stimulated pyrophosphate-energized sodium pump
MEGTGKPEYDKCVAISTQASLKKMMLPGAIALLSPLIIGFAFGPEVLGGFLAGATVSGVLMGMFQNNAGGAWDNAKKSFEKGVEINGEMFYKKSDPHKASVTGDTVGDPFKDTSGPSMNILIKLMSIVSLVIAPTLATIYGKAESKQVAKHEVMNEMRIMKNDSATADSTGRAPIIKMLQKDGIIKGENYNFELKNGSIFIDGVKLADSITVKYKDYINK